MKIKQVIFSLLFCLIFIGCFMSNNIYADTIEGYVPTITLEDIKSGEIGTTFNDSSVVEKDSDWSVSGSKIKIEYLGGEIKKYFCEKFAEAAQNGFTDMDFIFEVKVEGVQSEIDVTFNGVGAGGNCNKEDDSTCEKIIDGTTYSDTFPITNVDTSFLNAPASGHNNLFTITFVMGEDTYILKTHTLKDCHICNSDFNHIDSRNKANMSYTYGNDSIDGIGDVRGDNAYQMALNAWDMLEYFQECAIEGIIAGSIGAGFNVATPYSDNQIPLTDIMEISGGGYDFKQLSNAKYTLEYYYSPIFGKLYAYQEPYIPRTTDEWIEYGKNNVDTFIHDYSISLVDGFADYANSLSETSLNEYGEKISSITIENGAKRMGLASSTDPRSVLSYNIQMAVPFLFTVTDGKAQMVPNALRVIDGYTFNLYQDKIYSNDTVTLEDGSTGKKSVNMNEVMGSGGRDYIYLYNQTKDVVTVDSSGNETSRTVKYGIVLIALFDECVVDTTTEYDSSRKTSNLYLTGRKIGLDGGYSDVMNITSSNANIMFVQGIGGVKSGFTPLNIIFPETTEGLKIHNLHSTFTGPLEEIAPQFVDAVEDLLKPWDDDKLYEHINNKEMHGKVPDGVQVMHFLIEFDKVLLNLEVEDTSGSGTSEVEEVGVYKFFCIRNNNYIYDEGLLEWLKSDGAQSLTYVKADDLIAKITGDFSKGIQEISYSEWLAMQEIKREFQRDKDMWFVRVMNVLSIVLGIALIIFAVLFMLAYWVDIFNVFFEFSILYFISFGNLYSVSSDDMGEYFSKKNSNCKYVTFKDVLIIACIMLAFGVLFLNIESIMYFIIYLYNYFLHIVGGVLSW